MPRDTATTEQELVASGEVREEQVQEPEQSADTAGAPSSAQLEDRLRRALADLANLRQRYTRQLEAEGLAERDRVAAAFLDVPDNLERALAHADADPSALLDGVRAVRDQAVHVLESLGYKRLDQVGVPFDPAVHEAVGVVRDDTAAPGTVLQVLRPGYGDGDRQLRPAAVVVSTAAGPE